MDGAVTARPATHSPAPAPRWDWDAAARRAGASADGHFNAAAMALPGDPAVIWRRADGRVSSYTGEQLRRRAMELAAVLAGMGVRRGDRVAGLLGRRPASFVAALAVWHLGAVYVPMFSGFGGDGLRARLADCQPAAAITDTASRAGLDAVSAVLPGLRIVVVDGPGQAGDTDMLAAIERGVSLTDPARTGLHETSTIMYTSGTTGRPKGCQIPHHAVLTLAPYVRDFLALAAGDVLFSGADAGWSFGLFTTGFAPMMAGISRVIYEGPFDPAGWWDTVATLSAGHLAAAPTAFRQLAAAGPDLLPAQFTAGSSAGEPLDAATIDWFRNHAGVVVHDSYGLSELGMVIGNLRAGGPDEVEPGCMGTAVPGFEVALTGPDGEFLAGEAAGRIAVRDNGFLLSSGYWGREQEWDARFAGEWFITEDIARRDEAGRYWFVGRADDVIVSSGYNVGPAEVETALLRHHLVTDAACVGEPDPVRGTVVAAHVVLAGDAPPDLLSELRKCVGAGVGWYAAPRRLHVHDDLPRTDSGKIQRHLLRAAAATAPQEGER
jgi:acetyl-CoA synthetase